jgi:Ca2+-binding RTX toxin-like protein
LNDLTDAQAGAVSLSYVAGALAATVDYDFKDGSGTATVAPEKAVLNASIVQGSTTTVQDSSDTAEELTVNVTSSAATQTLTIDAADFDASLTVTGGAAGTVLDMDATNITSDIVDLSGVTSNILWAGGNDTQTVTGGSGDDKFTFTTFLDYQDSVDGGAGNDRVVIDPAASITQAVTLTNIEELEIGATATVSVTMTGQTVPEIVLQAQNGVTNVVTLTNAAGITNILATGGAAGGTDDDFNGLTLSGTGYAATTDALTMTLVASTDTVDTGAFTLTGIEDLTIAVTGADTDLNATIGTGITGSSLNNVTVTSSGYGASSDSTDIVLGTVNDGGSDTMLSFDASGANTGVSVTLADMQAASVVEGSAYYDTISVAGSGANTIVNGGAGNDTLTAATGATTLNGGAGNDTLNGGAGGDFLNSGTGNDTIDGNGGDDTVVLGVGSHTIIHAGNATGDGSYTISGFTAGAGGDVIDFQTNAASEGAATVSNYESVANAGTVSAGTGLVVVGGTSVGGVAESDVETLLGAGAANITLLGAFNAATDEFYLLTDDGTNSYLFNVDSGGTTAGVTAAEETITLYVTFSGIADCTTLTAANFADFI